MNNIIIIACLLHFISAILLSAWILAQLRPSPESTWGWILGIFMFPLLGMASYSLLGYHKHRRRKRRSTKTPDRKGVSVESLKQRASPNPITLDFVLRKGVSAQPETSKNDSHQPILLTESEFIWTRIQRLVEGITSFPATTDNLLEILDDGNQTFAKISEAISHATHTVFFQTFIFEPDATGTHFMKLLIEKAKSGVMCFLLIDDVGSYRLGSKPTKELEDAGVRIARFGKVRLSRPYFAQMRNHRKIIVVDNRIGFVGSQNVGNEYLRWRTRKLPWTDIHLKIEGPAVRQLATVFAEDWTIAKREKTTSAFLSEYFSKNVEKGQGRVTLQMIPTDPNQEEFAFEQLLILMLSLASRRIILSTPYLIPTMPFLIAIASCANRGVNIDILIPHKSEQRIVDLAGRGWYSDLIQAGAKIFEIHGQFPHEKVITLDESISLVGSANMDQRSFRLNCECGAIFYDYQKTQQLIHRMEAIVATSARIIPSEYKHDLSFAKRILIGAAKALSPIL